MPLTGAVQEEWEARGLPLDHRRSRARARAWRTWVGFWALAASSGEVIPFCTITWYPVALRAAERHSPLSRSSTAVSNSIHNEDRSGFALSART